MNTDGKRGKGSDRKRHIAQKGHRWPPATGSRRWGNIKIKDTVWNIFLASRCKTTCSLFVVYSFVTFGGLCQGGKETWVRNRKSLHTAQNDQLPAGSEQFPFVLFRVGTLGSVRTLPLKLFFHSHSRGSTKSEHWKVLGFKLIVFLSKIWFML